MNRPYTAQSPHSPTSAERPGGLRTRPGGREVDPRSRAEREDLDRDRDTDVYPPYPGTYGSASDVSGTAAEAHRGAAENYPAENHSVENYDDYLDEARLDRRWMWIAGVAGAVLFVAVIAASMILGGGDSGSVSATVASAEPSTSEAPEPTAGPTPRARAPIAPSLPAETVTTVSPTAPAPVVAAPVLPAPQAAPPPPAAVPGTVTYQVTGSRNLIDLVTIIYTDQRGALQTEVNAALPWTKTVTLDPGVTLASVTGTSVAGRLNCSIVDANGAPIATQTTNSIITNCTR